VNLDAGSGFPFLTGMAGCYPGRSVTLVLRSVITPLTLTKLDGSSLPENQLIFPLAQGAVSLQMTVADQSVTFLCDAAISKWRMTARNF
jgi:hypothetical protein